MHSLSLIRLHMYTLINQLLVLDICIGYLVRFKANLGAKSWEQNILFAKKHLHRWLLECFKDHVIKIKMAIVVY